MTENSGCAETKYQGHFYQQNHTPPSSQPLSDHRSLYWFVLFFLLPKWGPIFGPLWQDLISFRALVRGQFCGPQSDPNWGHQGTPKRHLLHNLLGPFFVVLRAPGKPDCGWLIGGVCKSPLFQCMFWLLGDGARLSLSWARASLSQALFKIAAWETQEVKRCHKG